MTMTHKEALAFAAAKSIVTPGSTCIEDDLDVAIRAYVEARGLVLVPYLPTQAMLDEVTAADQSEPFSDMTMSGIYRQMLSAAPDPFEEGE